MLSKSLSARAGYIGTRLAKSGVPIHESSRLWGHTNLETTFRYPGLTEDSVENAAAALDKWNEASESLSVIS